MDNISDAPANMQSHIVGCLRDAQMKLQQAYNSGFQASPLVQNIPQFQRMEQLAKEVAGLMLEVSKMRGL